MGTVLGCSRAGDKGTATSHPEGSTRPLALPCPPGSVPSSPQSCRCSPSSPSPRHEPFASPASSPLLAAFPFPSGLITLLFAPSPTNYPSLLSLLQRQFFTLSSFIPYCSFFFFSFLSLLNKIPSAFCACLTLLPFPSARRSPLPPHVSSLHTHPQTSASSCPRQDPSCSLPTQRHGGEKEKPPALAPFSAFPETGEPIASLFCVHICMLMIDLLQFHRFMIKSHKFY